MPHFQQQCQRVISASINFLSLLAFINPISNHQFRTRSDPTEIITYSQPKIDQYQIKILSHLHHIINIRNNFMGNDHPINSDIKNPIVVTGATGLLGQNIIKILLEKGYYVKGTVRYLALKEKYHHLTQLPGSERLILTEADITDSHVWDKVLQGIDYVIHAANPDPPLNIEEEEEITKPSVEGVENVMKAAIRQGVKRVIYTSSATTLYQHTNAEVVLDQNTWGVVEGNFPEPKSRILAEKKIWEIYDQQDLTKPHTELVVLLPSLIVGPLYSSHTTASQALLTSLFSGQFKGIPTPEVIVNAVDVRDVAEAHCLALSKPNVDNERITITAEPVSYTDICKWLHNEFPHAPIPTEHASLEKIAESGTYTLHRTLTSASKYEKLSNAKSGLLLGIKYHGLKESVSLMAKDLIKLGVVKYE